jgi:1-acyl-sn-glycerol-3-phosphate acyltransferase
MLRVMGWRIEGRLPDHGRIVAIVAPHSSYWDFLVCIALVFSWNLRIRFIAKKEIFTFPLGPLLKWLGGIPVDRKASQGFVDQVVVEIERSGTILLGIAPEGTRRHGARWKTGFYRIAKQCDGVIVPVTLDWRTRVIGLLPPVAPGTDLKTDLPGLVAQFLPHIRKDGRTIDPKAAVAELAPAELKPRLPIDP